MFKYFKMPGHAEGNAFPVDKLADVAQRLDAQLPIPGVDLVFVQTAMHEDSEVLRDAAHAYVEDEAKQIASAMQVAGIALNSQFDFR